MPLMSSGILSSFAVQVEQSGALKGKYWAGTVIHFSPVQVQESEMQSRVILKTINDS